MKENSINTEEKAYNYAIYLLGLKLRTEGELREKMRLKNYSVNVINAVITQLQSNKYIDDQRYAEVYVENLKKYKNFGYYGIKKKLMEKRLQSGTIENVLTNCLPEHEEIKIANKFLKKEKEQNPQKLGQKLRSRGFNTSVITKILFQ